MKQVRWNWGVGVSGGNLPRSSRATCRGAAHPSLVRTGDDFLLLFIENFLFPLLQDSLLFFLFYISTDWLTFSSLFCDIKDTYDAITSTDGKHLTTIAEIGREASTRQVVDSVARLKETVTIEDLDFIRARASCQNQVI